MLDLGQVSMLTVLFWSCLWATPSNVRGKQFTASAIDRGDNGLFATRSADFNNDGWIDVVVAAYWDDKVAWYENQGNGVFSEQRIISNNAGGPVALFPADIDADGFIDIICASGLVNKVVWFRNEGNGRFSSQRVVAEFIGGLGDVASCDADGDGSMDVIVASWSESSIFFFLNQGNGTQFSNRNIISSNAIGTGTLFITDLNNDGALDVIVGSGDDDTVAWYPSNGNGTFGGQRVITNSANGVDEVYAADLDNDGYADVLSASFLDDTVAWYRNMGDGSFSSANVLTQRAFGAGAVLAGDFNNDGLLDVMYGSRMDGVIAWHVNRGGGKFDFAGRIRTVPRGSISLAMADFDLDGMTDILTVTAGNSETVWYLNSGSDRDSRFAVEIITTNVEAPCGVFAADLNNDGLPDVLSASQWDGKVAWYVNEGRGQFSEQQLISTMDSADALLAGDLDGDGWLDVVAGSLWGSTILWFRNTGAGGFEEGEHISNLMGANSLAGADFNSDGLMDLLIASSSDDTVAWYQNDGDGVFSGPNTITRFIFGVRCVEAADVNNDGLPDVLSASEWDDTVAWFENQGDGTFSEARIISGTVDGASSIFLGDFNGDGWLDVVAAASNSGIVGWFRNIQGNSFSAILMVSNEIARASAVSAADLNDDGHLDILCTSYGNGAVSWFKNSGGGDFEGPIAIDLAAQGARANFVADLNGDGLMDVIGAAETSNTISWYTWENVSYSYSMVANSTTCEETGHCRVPPVRPPDTLQINRLVEDMVLMEPWDFPSGGPVSIVGRHGISNNTDTSVTVECHTASDPCIRFGTMAWAKVKHISFHGSSAVFIDARNVLSLELEDVGFAFEPQQVGNEPTFPLASILRVRGVHNVPMSVTMRNCSFRALHRANSVVAIEWLAQVLIEDTVFDDVMNERGGGGALRIVNTNQVNILSSSFRRCGAQGGDGGALGVVSITNEVLVFNCSFDFSSAERSGGAIWASGVKVLKLDTTSFRHGVAKSGSGGGVAIQIPERGPLTEVTIDNCEWSGNSAAAQGGGLAFVDGSSLRPLETYLTIQGSIFENNSASFGGGTYIGASMKYEIPDGETVQLRSLLPRVRVYNTEYVGNSANEQGGGLFSDGVNLFSRGLVFVFNTANLQGGGAWSTRSALLIAGTQFISNVVVGTNFSTVLVRGRGVGGGALFASDCVQYHIVLQSVDFRANFGSGGGVFGVNCAFEVENGEWYENSVENETLTGSSQGGAFALTQFGELVVRNSSFVRNIAEGLGGAVFCAICRGMDFTDVSMEGNEARMGAAIYTEDMVHVLSVRASSFINGSANSGSAMALIGSRGALSHVECRENGWIQPRNSVWTNGGCVFLGSYAAVSVNNTAFVSNHASLGESIYVSCSASLEIANSFLVPLNRSTLSFPSIGGHSLYSECRSPEYDDIPIDQAASGTVAGTWKYCCHQYTNPLCPMNRCLWFT